RARRGCRPRRAGARPCGRGPAVKSCPGPWPRAWKGIAESCPLLQTVAQAADPAGDLVQGLVTGQVHVDGRDGNVAGAHGVEIGAGAGVLLGTGRTDPPHAAATRVALLDTGFGPVPVAQAGHLEAAQFLPGQVR